MPLYVRLALITDYRMTVHGTTCFCYHCLDGSPLGEGKAKGVKP